MSQKAWMQAYTKGSKSLQARLAKIHAKNPEFQDFVNKHGFGGTLSVKQSGLQKQSVATVKPVDQPHPESKKGPADREAMIRAAALKVRARRAAASNRVAFGGELGGGFTMPLGGFRTYREAWDESGYKWSEQSTEWKEKVAKEKKSEAMRKAFPRPSRKEIRAVLAARNKTQQNENVSDTMQEDIPYKDAAYTMHRGGWVVKRSGKVTSIVLPTEHIAKQWIDSSRITMSAKVASVIRRKAREIAHGMGRWSMANESAANRRRVRSWDSAIMPEMRPLTVKPKSKKLPFDADPPKKNPGVVVGRNDPNYSRARHLARLGLKKAMEQGK